MLAERHRRFERLAHLVVDAGLDEPQRVPAVERAHVQPRLRKLVLRQFDDAIGEFRLVDADQDGIGLARARRAQDVEPGAVAVVDLEAEVAGRADHVDVGVDDRDVDVARQQRLAHHLAEPAETDDQHATGEARRLLDAVHRDRGLRQEAIEQQHHDRRERHRQDHDGRHHGPRTRVEDARRQRGGIEHEGEFAALREQGRALHGLAVIRAERPRDCIDSQRLHGHECGDAGRNDLPVRRDDAEVERHADREEEQSEQDAAKRLDVGFELMPERRFGQQHAGDECAHRHRQAAPLHEQRGAEHDQQRRSGHDVPAAERSDDAEHRVDRPAPRRQQAAEAHRARSAPTARRVVTTRRRFHSPGRGTRPAPAAG